MRSLNANAAEEYVTEIVKIFYAVEADPDASTAAHTKRMSYADRRQQWVIDQLFALTKGASVTQKEELVLNVLQFFFFHASYDYTGESLKTFTFDGSTDDVKRRLKAPMSSATRALMNTRCFALLGYLNSTQLSSGEVSRGYAYGTMSSGISWVYKVFLFQMQVEEDDTFTSIHTGARTTTQGGDAMDVEEEDGGLDHTTMREAIKKTVAALKKQINSFYRKAKKTKNPNNRRARNLQGNQRKAYQLLLLHLALLLDSNPEEVGPALLELIRISNELFETDTYSMLPSVSSGMGDEDEEDDIEPVNVITDVFVHLLSRPSGVIRDITTVRCVLLCLLCSFSCIR